MSDLELTMMRRVGELKAENARLKDEVERLTKAGDEMALAMAIGDRKEYGGVSDPIEDYLKARKEIQRWNAAKEGKQS